MVRPELRRLGLLDVGTDDRVAVMGLLPSGVAVIAIGLHRLIIGKSLTRNEYCLSLRPVMSKSQHSLYHKARRVLDSPVARNYANGLQLQHRG
jgi:hypothetical protein